MASYDHYYNYDTSYYDPEPVYFDPGPPYYDPEPYYDYDPEPAYDDPEPRYYDMEPSDAEPETYEDDTQYNYQPYEDDASGDFCGDYGYEVDAEDQLVHEGFFGGGNVGVDFGNEEQWNEEQYVLSHPPEYDTDNSPVHAAENAIWQPPFDPDTATLAEVDACAWRSHYARGPPPDVPPDAWHADMEEWRLEIDANLQAEAAAALVDDADDADDADESDVEADTPKIYGPPTHVPWVTEMLVHLRDAHEHGELLDDEYTQRLEELQADELEEQGLLADGWIWDEERGDYWHPERGWGADGNEEEDEPSDAATPLSDTTGVTHFLDDPAPPHPADVDLPGIPVALDADADALEDIIRQAAGILALHANPSRRIARPAPRPTRKRSMRWLMPPPMTSRRTVRSPPRRVPRSASARAKGTDHRTPSRRTRSCPDFSREAPPHLSKSADVPTSLTAAVAAMVGPPSTVLCIKDTVPPDIPDAAAATAAAPPPKHAVRARERGPPDDRRMHSAHSLPAATTDRTLAPEPPDLALIVPAPTASPSAERRCNALRRLAKKGKG